MKNTYAKIFTLKGYYFTKEYVKNKKSKINVREVLEDTVRKHFKNGDCNIEILFEETNKLILITPDSPKEEIIKYLGERFAPEY